MERIINILANHTEIEKAAIKPSSNLVKDLQLSSFDVMNLICEFEDEFDIEVPDHVIKTFIAVQDLYEYLNEIGVDL